MAGTLYLLGMSQFLLVLCVVLFYPDVRVQLFMFYPQVVNGTLSHDPGDTRSFETSMYLPVVVGSFLATVFVSTTFQLQENGQLGDNDSYSLETLAETGLWDYIFWAFVSIVHLTCVMLMGTPLDIFAMFLSVFLQVNFLVRICYPNREEHRNVTKSNINIMGLAVGFMIMMYTIPSGGNNRYVIFFLLFLFDYFLCIGHVWDNSPRMVTIGNCRLCYATAVPLCMACLYGAWKDKLLFNPVSSDFH
jgi:hypothetical protein